MTNSSKALWQLTRGQRYKFAAALIALCGGTLLSYAGPQIVRLAIDGILDHSTQQPRVLASVLRAMDSINHPQRALLISALLTIACATLGGALMFIRGRWNAQATEAITRRLRLRLYDHLQHLPVAYHDKAQTGDQVQRCTSDVDTVRMLFSNQAMEIARAVVLLAVGLPLMFWMDTTLAWVGISMLPVIVGFSLVFFRLVRDSFKKMDTAEGAMTAALQENLSGIRVVRAFARQDYESARFAEKNRTHLQLNQHMFRIMSIYWSSSDFFSFAQGALVLFIGAWRVSQGKLSVGTLVAFLSCVFLYLWPVRQMGRVLTEISKATVAMGRIQEILDTPAEQDSLEATAELPEAFAGEVRFDHVSLTLGGTNVLNDISLHIPAGQTLALVGPSGSGKTSLMLLLLRLLDSTSGRIELDGIDVSTLRRKYVREQFGVVMQEPFLFSKTLRENIRLGRATAAENELVDSAIIASIHESIEAFEQRYDTIVGERGVTLSGGQRQRVAIARAILREAPVLILDDALSAVDTHTETLILRALRERHGQRTTIIIAHRLSTLMHADQIAVLEKGVITQFGTHDDLIEQEGLYRQLWNIQTALEEDLSRELDTPSAV